MSTVCFLCTVLTTHIQPCPDGMQPFICPPEATKGSKKAIKWMEQYYGTGVIVVNPALITSTDDMNLFVFRGIVDKKDGTMKLVSEENYNSKSTRSVWSEKETDANKNGLRIKIASTGTAAGQSAPLYIVVSVSNEQMPKDKVPDGFLVLAIEGFCVGGTINPHTKEVGYVAFVRSDGTQKASVLRFNHQNEVLIKFLNAIRTG